MDEREITEVAKVLADWNPLGEKAKYVRQLDGYRTEAIDIIFHLGLRNQANPAKMVMQILNEAFDLSLSLKECPMPGEIIARILKIKEN